MEKKRNNIFPTSVKYSVLPFVPSKVELYPPHKTISKNKSDFTKTAFVKAFFIDLF